MQKRKLVGHSSRKRQLQLEFTAQNLLLFHLYNSPPGLIRKNQVLGSKTKSKLVKITAYRAFFKLPYAVTVKLQEFTRKRQQKVPMLTNMLHQLSNKPLQHNPKMKQLETSYLIT